jgi:hypothetical protein
MAQFLAHLFGTKFPWSFDRSIVFVLDLRKAPKHEKPKHPVETSLVCLPNRVPVRQTPPLLDAYSHLQGLALLAAKGKDSGI